MDKVKQGNFLALCLLDALEDGNEKICVEFLMNHKTDPNHIVYDRGIAAIHYVCGMDNVEVANKVMQIMLEYGGDPNLPTVDDKMTPMHISAMYGRVQIFNLLLEKGGNVNQADGLNRIPIHYAIFEEQFDIVKKIQTHMLTKKSQNSTCVSNVKTKKVNKTAVTPKVDITKTLNNRNKVDEQMINRDDFSISLDKLETSEAQNIFTLTKENLSELSKRMSPRKSTKSIVDSWREKVQRSKNRKSILATYDNVDSLLSAYMSEEHLNFSNTDLTKQNEEGHEDLNIAISRTAFCKMMENIRSAHSMDESFVTANEEQIHDTSENFIKSPGHERCIVQLSEAYVHTDTEEGLIFYERRLISNTNPSNKKKSTENANETVLSDTTNITLPVDYETDALRAELTQFGETVGPITNSTKKLYLKRLVKYKRNPEKMALIRNVKQDASSNCNNYSIELERTLSNTKWFQKIPEAIEFETDMVNFFKNSSCSNNKMMREGHLKQSFIYLLIDPRISQNLPGESMFITKYDAWKRFIPSIFYVGKGKSSRPYAHLYDALKTFNRRSSQQKEESTSYSSKIKSPREEKLKRNPSQKLERILDIWKSGKGVVCLHVFHNILPAEAFTREASIIESLGLKHLTNMKVGDFYGPAKTWPMRRKKNVGTLILFKALQVYLAEGESQLSPSDLI